MVNITLPDKKILRSPLVWLFIISLIMSFTAMVINLSASIRLDEAQSIWASTKTVEGIVTYIARDVHVPLYSLILHFWIQFFGTNIIVLRFLSILFFLASIPAVYRMSLDVSDQRVSRITTSLYCLSPFLTWYSTETRMYTLLTLLTILSHIVFLRLLRSKNQQSKFAFIFVSILGLYSHYFFGIVLFFQTIYYATFHFTQPVVDVVVKGKKKNTKNVPASIPFLQRYKKLSRLVSRHLTLLQFFSLLGAIGLAFLPWIAFVLSQGALANTKPLLIPPTSYNLLQLFVHFFTGFQSATVQSGLISIWPLLVVLLFFSFSRKFTIKVFFTEYFFLMTFGPILLAFLISYTVQPILVSRYLIFITPTLFYLIAILLSHFNKTIFFAIMSIVLLSNFVFQYQQSTSDFIAEKENYKAVAEYLTKHTGQSDVIVVSAPFTIYPIEYQYKGRAKIETIPLWNRYVSGVIPPFKIEDVESQMADYNEQYNHMYVVLSYDQGYENEIKNYLSSRLELMNKITFSPGLELYEYRLPLSYRSKE